MTDFINQIHECIKKDTFVRLTLSKQRLSDNDLKKVIVKLVDIKQTLHLSFTYRHQTKDITKNFLVKEGIAKVTNLLSQQFYIGNLFTIQQDYCLEIDKKGKEKLKHLAPTFKKIPARSHDKSKQRLVQNTNYLTALGVLDVKGRIQKDKGDKYKQIHKFIEIIDSLLRQNTDLGKAKSLSVTDMGAGKGYLTFALYDYLVNTQKKDTKVKGIEIRSDLIAKCNGIAEKIGFTQLTFEQGFISDYDLKVTDILIALHACDTATDDAIYKGIKANASLIVCAPCCHKQIRKQMTVSKNLQPILDYGILKERQAEMVTDAIRALLLEASGYKTKVFEFISTEHTGKNVMIVGQKRKGKPSPGIHLEKIKKLKSEFGIQEHYLENLLQIKS